MKKILTVMPIPITGLMLGVFALSKLYYGLQLKVVGHFFLAVALIILFLLCLKIIFIPKHLIEAMNHPVVASILPTFTMSLLLLSGILKSLGFNTLFTNFLWVISSATQIIYVLYYIYRFLLKEKVTMQSVIPGWFVTFGGLSMITATTPDFAYQFGSIIFFVASTALVILLPFVLKRIFIMRDLPNPVKPMITFLASPFSLTIIAYFSHFKVINELFIIMLIIIAQFLYIIVLYGVQLRIKSPFYPSFGAFTFPLVVSAIGLLMVKNYLSTIAEWMGIFVYFETIVGTSVVLFVFYKYVQYMVVQNKLYM